MISNDYVNYMSQKYRLAIAIAVLKSKPTELTVKKYIDKLKDKLNENMDIDIISINSNDFNFDEDVFNEFNESFHGANENCISSNDNNDVHSNNNLAKSDVKMREISNVLDILRNENQQNPTLLSTQNCTQSTYYDESECNSPNYANNSAHKPNEIPNKDVFNKIGNIQDVNGTYKVENSEMANKIAKNISKQIDNEINNAYKENGSYGDNNYKTTTITTINHSEELDRNEITLEETQNFNTKIVDEKLLANVIKNISKLTNKEHFSNAYCNGNEKEVAVVTNLDKDNKYNTIDTQETVIYTLYDITDIDTHISQSQFENIEIKEIFLHGNRNNRSSNKFDGNIQNIFQENVTNDNDKNFEINVQKQRQDETNRSQDFVQDGNIQILQNENIDQDFSNTQLQTQVQNENNIENDNVRVQIENNTAVAQLKSLEIEYIIDKNGKTYKMIQNYPINKKHSTENLKQWTLSQVSHDSNTNSIIVEEKEIEKDFVNNIRNIQGIQDQYNDIEDINKESVSESIPFKVIEELNKVKTYLNKWLDRKENGYSTDSGYKSDSQSRSSSKLGKMSENWLNQSAYSLYAHLTECPLLAATEEITNEISQVIGKLIDRLHEEETYPSFIEDILQNIECLLDDIFKRNSGGENVLLKKEENFQRLCLLNNSSHILQYTIDKITLILEEVHTKLIDNETLYEIENIEEVENLTYIFHTIQILIPKYMKNKLNENCSQNQSQEDKLFKKSSITEIWRRKWNPNFKEITHFKGRCEKKDILTKLADVLNKIIINCIDGYSLVAFAALQCFNLLQK